MDFSVREQGSKCRGVYVKSKVYFLSSAVSHIKRFVKSVECDKVSVHAAQASFFVITSAAPFISLFIAVIGALIPAASVNNPHGSGVFSDAIAFLKDEVEVSQNIPLISLSAVTALWSASRGVGTVREGIETVYEARRRENYFVRKLKSLLSTVIFMALITSLTALLLFGDFIAGLLGEEISRTLIKLRTPVFIVAVTVMFTVIYSSIAKRSANIRHGAIYHLPGALVSAVGWIVFSYFYSLYISNFPGASYIYGSLAAVCLIMLWIYFCMMILFFGAEINKLYFAREKYSKQGDA